MCIYKRWSAGYEKKMVGVTVRTKTPEKRNPKRSEFRLQRSATEKSEICWQVIII